MHQSTSETARGFSDVCDDDEGWIRAGSGRRNKQRKQAKPRAILRCSATQRPDGCRPPAGLTDVVADDDLITLRRKYDARRNYFLHSFEGRTFFTDLVGVLDHVIGQITPSRLDPNTIDVLCLGLGNPAVDRASLNQLAVLDLLLDHDKRLTRERTRLYDPVFRSVARTFIRELRMQVLETNEEACYPLDLERYHFIMLPHCAPALVNNLLYANWNCDLLGRIILFSNSWPYVRYELAASGEPDLRIALELSYMYTLESVIMLSDRLRCDSETDFEGMRLQWFPIAKLRELPASTWITGPERTQTERSTTENHPVHPKVLSSKDCFYADMISRDLIPTFLDSSNN